MKVIKIDKNYSWLQWPCTLKGCDKPTLHLTTKFFGDAQIDPTVVERMIVESGIDQAIPVMPSLQWEPQYFDPAHVLVLKGLPQNVVQLHNLFGLIKDQYVPYTPHITVPFMYWQDVKTFKPSPSDQLLSFGELELFLGVKGMGEL